MTHPDIPEFLAILERVPKWHMLMPGKDKWQNGDQYVNFNVTDEWTTIPKDRGGIVCAWQIGRRPIPEHVRRSEAWWALYNQLATVAPNDSGYCFRSMFNDQRHGRVSLDFSPAVLLTMRKFETEKEALTAIPILGGEAEIIKNLQEGPGAYMRWVLGNK